MAKRKESQKVVEQTDNQAAIMVAPVVTVLDTATGETESLWVWELED